MSFVLDNSVVTGWWTVSQATSYTEAVLEAARQSPPHAPALWVLEFANVLRRARLERSLTEAQLHAILRDVAALGIRVESSPTDAEPIVRLALRWGLSAYDAAYLELALRLELPLACKDSPLATAARRAGVGVFAPAGTRGTR